MRTQIVAIGLACLLAVGCSKAPTSTVAEETATTRHSFTVLGIDRTESDAMTRQGIEIAKGYVLAARPCDRLQLRWISHRSFLASEIIGDLRLPCLPSEAAAFDAAASRRYRQAQGTIENNRREALATLSGFMTQTLGSTPRTDLIGFVAVASMSLSDAPDMLPQMIIVSDLEDNARRSATVDLESVSVSLHLIGNESNPQHAQSLVESWATALKEMGAREIRVRSEPPSPYVVSVQ